MILVFDRPAYEEVPVFAPTVSLLEAVRPAFEALADGLSGDRNSVVAKNTRIRRALVRLATKPFGTDRTLEDFIDYIKEETRDPQGQMIAVYVDPVSLQEAEKTMKSTLASVDLDGVPLRTSLQLGLKQLGLAYVVKDGLIYIISAESDDELLVARQDAPYQIVGHCLVAVIAAALGGAAAPLVCNLARGRSSLCD